MLRFAYLAILCSVAVGISGEQKVAIAHLLAQNIVGSVRFTETDEGLRVTGAITGLPEGSYGFHVHELGDISTCLATGAHYNPDDTDHGGRDHDVRHVGDLGNVVFVGNETAVAATIDFVDEWIALSGRNNILGRALVLHEQEDDLGLGGHETSLTTGNAGGRVACGVIGIMSPAGPWNSAVSLAQPTGLLTLALAIMYVFKS